MKKIQIFASVKDGKLCNFNRSQFVKDLAQFEGRRIELTIQSKSKRTVQQNRYWWACITILSNHIGFEKEEMHAICKMKFLKREKVDEKTGEIFPLLISSTELTKSEFSEMTEELIRWSSETFGVVLPIPNEQLEIITSKND